MGAEVPDAISGLLAGLGPGMHVAGYLLEERVGAGGMAVVFLATDERLRRRVALKVLAPALASDQTFRQRFIRESRAAAAVDDPHIIPVYEAGEAGGVLFIAMRYVPSRDVRTLLHEHGRMTAARATAIISPVASALDAAHAVGLVHRDVKPANMLIDVRPDRPDHVYLSDFGLTKGASSAGLTGSGQFLGTPSYTAPEQIRGEPVDGRADQYALACAAFEMLTGEPPFDRDQGMAVLLAHLHEPVPSVSTAQPSLPPEADRVFARALAKEPGNRYPTCREFADALREATGLAPYYSGRELASPSREAPFGAMPVTDRTEAAPQAHEGTGGTSPQSERPDDFQHEDADQDSSNASARSGGNNRPHDVPDGEETQTAAAPSSMAGDSVSGGPGTLPATKLVASLPDDRGEEDRDARPAQNIPVMRLPAPVRGQRVSRSGLKGRRALVFGAAAVVLLGGGITGWLLSLGSSSPPSPTLPGSPGQLSSGSPSGSPSTSASVGQTRLLIPLSGIMLLPRLPPQTPHRTIGKNSVLILFHKQLYWCTAFTPTPSDCRHLDLSKLPSRLRVPQRLDQLNTIKTCATNGSSPTIELPPATVPGVGTLGALQMTFPGNLASGFEAGVSITTSLTQQCLSGTAP